MIAHVSPVAHSTVLALGAVAIGTYAVAWGRQPGHRSTRYWGWMLGVASVLGATTPPVERLAQASFTGHMIQHLILLLVAPPLLVLARPYDLWLTRRAGREVRWSRHLLAPATSAALRRVAPLEAAGAFIAVLAATHLSPLYDLSLRHQAVHDLEHALYLGSAVALWAAILARRPSRAGQRLVAVFAVIAGTNLVGLVLLATATPLVPTYARQLGPTRALADQQAAAALMWASGMATTLPLLLLTVWRWAMAEERRARIEEQLADRAATAPERWTEGCCHSAELPRPHQRAGRVVPGDQGIPHPGQKHPITP